MLTSLLILPVVALFAAGCASSKAPATNSAPTANGPGGQYSSSTHRSGRGMAQNVPAGDKSFFGMVSVVNGSTVTLSGRATTTVMLTSSTKYTGGAQTDIQIGKRILGYGTPNADGSITAVNVTVNMPNMPQGGFRGGNGGATGSQGGQGGGYGGNGGQYGGGYGGQNGGGPPQGAPSTGGQGQ